MKKYIFISVIIISAGILYASIADLKKQGNKVLSYQSTVRDTFTNCIFNSPYWEINSWNKLELEVSKNLANYKELNFNAVQWYDGGSNLYGKVDGQLSDGEINNFKSFLNEMKQANLLGFYERSFLGKYCYGQRLIYEVSPANNNTELNFGFVYQQSMNNTYETDEGRTVIHAKPGVQSEGYLCSNIYENLQQSDLFDFRQDDKGTWYIKPVMKIPAGMPDNIEVVRIDVVSFKGDVVKQIVLNTDNFKNNGAYSGGYLENYFNLPEHSLEIQGDDKSQTSLNFGRNENWWEWDENCKVDFRIHWYGKCEVWFDKLIVDDKLANELFDPNLQPDINSRIKQESENFGNAYSFFFDEVLISQYPCLQYLVRKMREYNSNSRVSIAVTNYLHIHGLRNDNLTYQVYLDSIKPEFLQTDHHGFYVDKNNNGIKIPDVLRGHDNNIPDYWYTTASDYNDKLQTKIFGSTSDAPIKHDANTLIFEMMKTKGSIAGYNPETKFIMQPQIHGWFTTSLSGVYESGLREPTNEEIQAQAMISLAHGANGLCWFAYNSHIWTNANNKSYLIGLLDPVNGTTKRTVNCYGQNKWEYVSAMNGKLLKWANVLEIVNWSEGFSVHSSGASHNYISDLKSIYRNAISPYAFAETNLDAKKYWELGFFNPKDAADKSKYFIAVNRRCIPEALAGTGDIRMLKIKFGASQLSGANNWILKDLNTGQEITFDKNNLGADGYLYLGNSASDIGFFLPGEGKFFKLTPA